ncbi:hypothetical protein [Lactobacillus panisapium]|nr:hypothetical protein [Lactobacillus panisapium]
MDRLNQLIEREPKAIPGWSKQKQKRLHLKAASSDPALNGLIFHTDQG